MRGLTILTDNPIFTREIRRRMRGRGLIIMMMLYLAAMCGIGYLIVTSLTSNLRYEQAGTGYVLSSIANIGQTLFSSIIMLQGLLVLLIAPMITLTMLRSEKERDTFDFLKVTAISPRHYVVGAFLSTLMYVTLSLLCALPVVMIAYIYGGVSDVAGRFVILFSASMVFSACGLLAACYHDGSKKSRVGLAGMSLVVVGILLGIPMMAGLVSGSITAFGGSTAIWPVPLWAVLLVVGAVVSRILLLAAERKLFVPGERMLNYRQFTAVAVVLLFGTVVLEILANGVAGPVSGAIHLGPWVVCGLAWLAQGSMQLARIEPGNDRWRIHKRHAWMRGRAEYLWYIAAFTLGGLALLQALGMALAAFGIPAVWPPNGYPASADVLFAAPLVAYLFCRGGIAEVLRRTNRPASTALRLLVFMDFALLIGVPWGAGLLLGSNDFHHLSPLGLASAWLEEGFPHSNAITACVLLVAVGCALWFVALRRPQPEAAEDLNFDLPL